MTINIVAIKSNGLTITDQASSQRAAAQKVLNWINDPFYSSPQKSISKGKISRVFFGSDEGLMEYALNEIDELAVMA